MAPDDENAFDAEPVAEAATQASLAEDMLALVRVMFGLTVPLAAASAPPESTEQPMHQRGPEPYDDAATAPAAPAPLGAPTVQSVPLPDARALGPMPAELPPEEQNAPASSTPRSVPVPAGIPVPTSPLETSSAADTAGADSHGGDSAMRPTQVPAAIPVPGLATEEPDSASPPARPRSKRSLELLQEIAFLEE